MSVSSGKLGKYSLTRHLATGGMAEIWLAEQAGPGGFNKELVIKRILPHFAEDKMFTTMFLDEARLAAQLSHPKIAQIYELGETEGQYFIAMEYIQGIDLDVMLQIVIDAGDLIPIGVVCKIVMDVLEALDYAHDFTDRNGEPFNLVHRDVSPHNVLVSNDGIVKLCDFGVAKAKANQTKTQPGAVKGKFAYMAPEQIQNAEDLDRRADVFAAGIMFYELLTGEKPFGDELAAINAIITARHPSVRAKRPDVPEALESIIDKALQKNRNERYPDAHAMMRDIEGFVRGLDDFVGDRELSHYARTVQGLPVTRHSQPAVATKASTEEDEADPLANTGAHGAVEPEPERITNKEAALAPTSTARISDGPTEPGLHPQTQSTDVGPPPKSNATLYIVAFISIVAIAAAIGVIAMVVLPTPGPKADPTPVKPVTKPTHAKTNPALLRRPGDAALPFWIRARPDGELFVGGELVGRTPFQATLPAGSYKVECRSEGKSKVQTIVVKPNMKNVLFDFRGK